MNTSHHLTEAHTDRLARQVAAQLDQGLRELPHDITERLRAARTRAVAARRQPVVVLATGARVQKGTLVLEGGPDKMRFWGWMGSLLPLIALFLGLFAIHTLQNDWRADELASVDAALLTDELPPTAYTDPGFLRFIRAGAPESTTGRTNAD
ncbi:MAG: DUF3619 family protein [Limnohabitans sp.]|jgi:hypothetical protein|nr:DUF3619 family protein [Limnohabitans sp.]